MLLFLLSNLSSLGKESQSRPAVRKVKDLGCVH